MQESRGAGLMSAKGSKSAELTGAGGIGVQMGAENKWEQRGTESAELTGAEFKGAGVQGL